MSGRAAPDAPRQTRPGPHVAPAVARALGEGRPVVALESALITHGLPAPDNLRVAERLEATVRAAGAEPATVALIDGTARVGLEPAELARLAGAPDAAKVGPRDLAAALVAGRSGGTTVAATAHLAHRAGLRVLCTGGIGGVHRGRAGDVSADLPALASLPLIVVCAGAKIVLDLSRTLEVLETLGVPVVGYGTDTFPAFTVASSGLPLPARLDSPDQVARTARAQWALGLPQALLVCAPVPPAAGLPEDEAQRAVASAVAQADARGIRGSALTPFLLAELARTSAGRSLAANEALLVNNAGIAARIARALSR